MRIWMCQVLFNNLFFIQKPFANELFKMGKKLRESLFTPIFLSVLFLLPVLLQTVLKI